LPDPVKADRENIRSLALDPGADLSLFRPVLRMSLAAGTRLGPYEVLAPLVIELAATMKKAQGAQVR
jgi:hypothetical protein